MRYTLLLHYVEATPEDVGVEEWKAAERSLREYLEHRRAAVLNAG